MKLSENSYEKVNSESDFNENLVKIKIEVKIKNLLNNNTYSLKDSYL